MGLLKLHDNAVAFHTRRVGFVAVNVSVVARAVVARPVLHKGVFVIVARRGVHTTQLLDVADRVVVGVQAVAVAVVPFFGVFTRTVLVLVAFVVVTRFGISTSASVQTARTEFTRLVVEVGVGVVVARCIVSTSWIHQRHFDDFFQHQFVATSVADGVRTQDGLGCSRFGHDLI